MTCTIQSTGRDARRGVSCGRTAPLVTEPGHDPWPSSPAVWRLTSAAARPVRLVGQMIRNIFVGRLAALGGAVSGQCGVRDAGDQDGDEHGVAAEDDPGPHCTLLTLKDQVRQNLRGPLRFVSTKQPRSKPHWGYTQGGLRASIFVTTRRDRDPMRNPRCSTFPLAKLEPSLTNSLTVAPYCRRPPWTSTDSKAEGDQVQPKIRKS